MTSVLYTICLLLLAMRPSYAQSLPDKLIGKWAFVSQFYIGEAVEFSKELVWNEQHEENETVVEFMADGKAKMHQQDTRSTFSLEDSFLLLRPGESTFKLRIEKITDHSLQFLYLDLMHPRFNAFEPNIIQSRWIYKRLPMDALTARIPAVNADFRSPALEEVEEMPEFPGGKDRLMNFLGRNVLYPKAALRSRINGTVLAEFTVSATGDVINGAIIHSPRIDFALEVVRIMKSMPR